jgi:hypothetical protein
MLPPNPKPRRVLLAVSPPTTKPTLPGFVTPA